LDVALLADQEIRVVQQIPTKLAAIAIATQVINEVMLSISDSLDKPPLTAIKPIPTMIPTIVPIKPRYSGIGCCILISSSSASQ